MKLFKTFFPVILVTGICVYPTLKSRWDATVQQSPKKINLIEDVVEQMKFKSELNIVSLLKLEEFTLIPESNDLDTIKLAPIVTKEDAKLFPPPAAVKEVKVSPQYKVNVSSVINAAAIDRLLKGVLKNKGQTIIQAAQKNGICPIFLTAVIMHESANGCSNFSEDYNNVAGIMTMAKVRSKGKLISKSVPRRFDSVKDCIEFTAKLLGGKTYAGGSRNTISAIQKVYCPVGAKNDPKKLNGYWLEGVLNNMEKIWGDKITIRS